jgi:hypothetical protein
MQNPTNLASGMRNKPSGSGRCAERAALLTEFSGCALALAANPENVLRICWTQIDSGALLRVQSRGEDTVGPPQAALDGRTTDQRPATKGDVAALL